MKSISKGYWQRILMVCLVFAACIPENIELPTRVKSVTTNEPARVTVNNATLRAHVDLIDTYTISCGVIYGTSSRLNSSNGTKITATANGDYSVNLSGLEANTTYYYRAYAFDAHEYMYGEVYSFKTLDVNSSTLEAINLGLSVKWASCNVGAVVPEDYGGYYAWGETEEKSDYSWSTYKWCNGSGDTMTKYCTSSRNGTVDNKTTLDLSDDVAHVKWGGSWRMPTLDEIKELINDCSWSWTTQNGVNGYKVTGPNGNSIFLPAAGARSGDSEYTRGSTGHYWSSTLDESDGYGANYLLFYRGSHELRCNNNRYYGQTVRPVTD